MLMFWVCGLTKTKGGLKSMTQSIGTTGRQSECILKIVINRHYYMITRLKSERKGGLLYRNDSGFNITP